jgi:thioredoxin-like negative regulator of GroEL
VAKENGPFQKTFLNASVNRFYHLTKVLPGYRLAIMKTFVRVIRPENFKEEVVLEKRPVLLLCMPRDEEFYRQMEILEAVAQMHGQTLKAGLLEHEFIERFRQDLGIRGTPTYLLLVQGKEMGRMLGLADEESLTKFISEYSQQPTELE